MDDNGNVKTLQTLIVSKAIRDLIGGVAISNPEVRQRLAGYLDGKGLAPEQEWALVIDEAHLEPKL